MVARGPGDVGCAHCTQIGATETCQVCTHLVCAKCAADWATCPQPSGRVVRLGMGGRLRDVDPLGRYALVSYMHKGPRLLDLRQLQWAKAKFPLSFNYLNALLTRFPPRLTSDGFVAHPGFSATGANSLIKGVWFHDVHGAVLEQKFEDCPTADHGTAVSDVGDLFSYVSEAQNVVVVSHQIVKPAPPPAPHAWESPEQLIAIQREWERDHPHLVVDAQSYDPLPRQVIHRHVVDGARHLIATGTWRVLALHRFEAGKLERLSQIDTKVDGNIHWLAIGGPFIAYVTGSKDTIHVRELDETLAIGDTVRRFDGPFGAGALSNDGRHLAIAIGDKLVVHDLDHNTKQDFTEHSDAISYVRFASDDGVLISGDDDNRVILRPRTDDGYARPLIPIELHEEHGSR